MPLNSGLEACGRLTICSSALLSAVSMYAKCPASTSATLGYNYHRPRNPREAACTPAENILNTHTLKSLFLTFYFPLLQMSSSPCTEITWSFQILKILTWKKEKSCKNSDTLSKQYFFTFPSKNMTPICTLLSQGSALGNPRAIPTSCHTQLSPLSAGPREFLWKRGLGPASGQRAGSFPSPFTTALP